MFRYRVTQKCFFDNVLRLPGDNDIVTRDKKIPTKELPPYLELIEEGSKPKQSKPKKEANTLAGAQADSLEKKPTLTAENHAEINASDEEVI